MPLDTVFQSHTPECNDALLDMRAEFQRPGQLRRWSRPLLQRSVGVVQISYSRLSQVSHAHPFDHVWQSGGKVTGSSCWLPTNPCHSSCGCKWLFLNKISFDSNQNLKKKFDLNIQYPLTERVGNSVLVYERVNPNRRNDEINGSGGQPTVSQQARKSQNQQKKKPTQT